jgi:hypothetical protein
MYVCMYVSARYFTRRFSCPLICCFKNTENDVAVGLAQRWAAISDECFVHAPIHYVCVIRSCPMQ